MEARVGPSQFLQDGAREAQEDTDQADPEDTGQADPEDMVSCNKLN